MEVMDEEAAYYSLVRKVDTRLISVMAQHKATKAVPIASKMAQEQQLSLEQLLHFFYSHPHQLS